MNSQKGKKINMEKIKKYKGIIIVIITIAVIVLIVFKDSDKSQEVLKDTTPEESSVLVKNLSDEEIKTEIDNTLDVLMRLHYISVIDKQSGDPNNVIVDELTESMNDLNKLEGLLYKTETISKSPNELISTTGKILNMSTILLTRSYNAWIEYLRGVDIYTADVAEFQYQLSLFQTSTHDTYLQLVEGASLLPMITVEFAKEEGEENSINEELKNHFLAKIDQLFSDIFIENDKFYKETKNRYAIAILVSGYKDFFNKAE